MGRTVSYIYKCDRCSAKEVFRNYDDGYEAKWGYNESTGLLLCPHCISEYQQFLEGIAIPEIFREE